MMMRWCARVSTDIQTEKCIYMHQHQKKEHEMAEKKKFYENDDHLNAATAIRFLRIFLSFQI